GRGVLGTAPRAPPSARAAAPGRGALGSGTLGSAALGICSAALGCWGRRFALGLALPEPCCPCPVCSYAGYCPRHKFSLGTPYGQLPSSPEVAGSSQLVLQPARWPCAGAPPVGQGEALLGTRPACWGAGAHPLGCCVIPGYTGFIPRAQNLFAKTYSEICKEARSDFARQQLRAAGKEQELQNAGRLPQCTKGKVSVTRATWHLSAAPP
uniref:Uncharacterized protein n=1 Tax=Chrysemys picta bellii TaxID=8478 RepID=A0A8C3IJC3_CHRPI